MKKAFIFDLFGTLVEVFEKEDYTKLLEDMSEIIDVPKKDFIRYWNNEVYQERMTGKFESVEKIIEFIINEIGLRRTEKQIEKAAQLRMDFTRKALNLTRKDLIVVLENIKARGYRIGIISDCSPDVPIVWEEIEYSKYFDTVIFSSQVGVKKPNPKIYKMAVDSLKVDFEDCYYIGDGGSNELTGARNVGMEAILIKPKEDEIKNIHRLLEDKWDGERIYSLSELMSYK
ncbi:MAG: putative hydrolase of the superfamily [Fusobacteriaceae bacterium]|nr:putative hydrolase of the superfamily [Fusobacteriaceae bacterium]